MSEIEDVIVGEEGEEAERPKYVKYDPRPSKEEVEEHNLTHLPYRNWCPHCVRGKAPTGRHVKRAEEENRENRVPVISMDYCYMGEGNGQSSEEDRGNPILVTYCRKTKAVSARVLIQKGVHWYSVKYMKNWIYWLGHQKICLKSDQESSISALKDAVKREVSVDMQVEFSPVGDSQSNGEAERAVRTVQAQVRTMKSALDEKYKIEIGENHALMPWLVSHAASQLCRFKMGLDGKTAYERCRGKKFRKSARIWRMCYVHEVRTQGKRQVRAEMGVWSILGNPRQDVRADYWHTQRGS